MSMPRVGKLMKPPIQVSVQGFLSLVLRCKIQKGFTVSRSDVRTTVERCMYLSVAVFNIIVRLLDSAY